MGTPEAVVSFQLASSGRRPQEEYGIRVDNSNKQFEHVWLQTSEDGSGWIHLSEKLAVMDFSDKMVSDAEPVKPPPVESTSLKVVQDVKNLKELVAKLRGAKEFAVSLKGNHFRSFQGFTCLMQISTRTEDFIVDTLKLRVQIGPYLREIFKDPTKRKVMHEADQCILWLQRDFGIYVCNMFDAGQASKVLKFEGNSLEFLLRHFFEVAANEECKHVDWRSRPLTDEMLRYAREDTHYLLFIYDLMRRRLLSSPTDPDCPEAPPLVEVYQRSSNICMQLYQKEILTENSYLNISGLHDADLNGQQLAIVAGLCKWRDATAREVDESTCYILSDEVLIEIAKQMPVTTLKLCHLLKPRHPYIVRNLGCVVSVITDSMKNAVAFEPVAKKLKGEHFEMMNAKNVAIANGKEAAEVAGSESTSNAVEADSFEKEVGSFKVGADQNHKLVRPQEKYKIRVNNSNQPFEHVWLQISEDGSKLIHPLEKFSVMDIIDKTVSDVEPVKPPPVETTPFKLVQDVKDLKDLATKLRDTDEFSVDLKHNQDRSFQGLTCLMQISTRTEDFVVDTLKLWVHIGPHLREVFKDHTKRKVMHGADRCILWLQRDFGIYVCNMFDTRQASKVLKLEGDSLVYLLRHFCEVAANEEYKNVDWRLRPLTDALFRYAREDTHHLLYMYNLMQRSLLSSPTDPNCHEASHLVEVYQRSYDICMQLYQKEILTENSYLNISGLHAADLNGQQLAVVAGLCELRDYIAREVDESTCYILPDKVLIEIAKQMPVTTLNLCHILKRRHPYIERNLGFILRIIMNSSQNAAVFEPAAKKLKEEHIEMMATRNVKFANVEEAADVAGSESTSNAVDDDTYEKKVGNFIVGAKQNHKLEGSSACRISIEATEKIKVDQIKPSVSLSFHSLTDKTEPSHAVVKESPTAQEIQVLPLASEPEADIIMLEAGSDVEETEEKPANDEGGEQKMEDENNVMLLDSDCCDEEKYENQGTMLLLDQSLSFLKCEENKKRKSDVEGGSGGLVKVTPFVYAAARKEARFGENGSDGEDGDGSKNQCKGERKKTCGGGRKNSAGAGNAKLTNGEESASVAGIGSTSNAVADDSVEKEVGNFIVGVNQNHKFDGSSDSSVSIEVQKKPSCAFGAMIGNEAVKRKYNLESKAAEEIKVEHKYSVSLTSHSFTDKTEPSRESDGAIAPEKEARTLFSVKIPVGDRHIIVETGEIAKQASGSVNLKVGGTTICTTVCISDVPSKPSDLFPMSVHHQERLSASGYTSGGYHKREGRLKDHEVLVCRRIDRALRPTMRKGFCHETQIVSMVLSYDGLHSPDSLAISAAGIAVALSEVPNTNTVAGVRIGLIGDKFVVNPTTMEMKESKLDLLLAGSETGISMIEGDCDLLPEEKLLQAMEVGMDAIRDICKQVDNLVKMRGKRKLLDSIKLPPPELYKHVEEIVGDELVRVLQIEDKIPRGKALSSLESKVLSILTKVEEFDEGNVHIKPVPTVYSEVDVKLVFKSVCSKYLRKQIVKGGKRSDGRTSKEIRSIASKCGQLSQTHGSALFTRGETQAMAVVTLGDKRMAQRIENLAGVDVKRFYLQYSFWPSCVGGVGKIGAPSRREIGHGTLAERALKPILPYEDDFPYTIRVESNITESNGSSSMASVCGGCLALQDAGVPLKSSIAGIAMGMVLDTKEFGGDGTPLILSDITGSEDAAGDMDFKVAGNDDGVTAFQMDIKVGGITLSIMKQALLQAKEGRKRILAEMLKCSPPPSKKLAKHAPLILVMKVEPEKVNLIIGFGGRTVKRIIEQTGVEYIDTQDIGTVKITSRDLANLEKAKAIISSLIMIPVVGNVYRDCKITSVVPYGVFIEIVPGRVGLCHVSELSLDRLSKPSDAFKVGDIVDVKVIKINEKGQPCLSRKALLPDQGSDKPNQNPRTAGGSNDGCRSGC